MSRCTTGALGGAASGLALGFVAGWLVCIRFHPVLHHQMMRLAQPADLQPIEPTARNAGSQREEPLQAVSLTTVGYREQVLLQRIYPLHADGVHWQSLSLRKYHVVLVTGPQRSGTTWAACALANTLGYTLYDERHPLTAGNDTLVALRRAFAYAREQRVGAVIQSPMATSILHELPLFPSLAIIFIARHCLDVFRSQNRVMPARGGWTCVAGRTKGVLASTRLRHAGEPYIHANCSSAYTCRTEACFYTVHYPIEWCATDSWCAVLAELRKYRRRPELRPYFDERDMICTIKQHAWQRHQRPVLERQARVPAAAMGAVSMQRPLISTVDWESFRTHPLWQTEEQRSNLSIKRTAGACAGMLRAATPLRTRRHVHDWLQRAKNSEHAHT